MTPSQAWETALAAWALPQELLDAAPADPWRLDPADFADRASAAHERSTPGDEAARDALPRRGSVLDVGCGAGAATVPLLDRAGRVTGVDGSGDMLAAYEAACAPPDGLLGRLRRSTGVGTVRGTWPAAAPEAPVADVVVCHDVLYNVGAGVDAFVRELTAHARERVVVVLPERHPLSWLSPYLEQLHGLRRPSRPTADMAADVVGATGVAPEVLPFTEPVDHARGDEGRLVRTVARRCCVGEERHDDVAAALSRVPPPTTRRMVALVWSP